MCVLLLLGTTYVPFAYGAPRAPAAVAQEAPGAAPQLPEETAAPSATLTPSDWQALQALLPITYLKASNTDEDDRFGWSVAADGNTVVIGARFEDSTAPGVNGLQNNNIAPNAGAAYVFVRTPNGWVQEAYLKASNPTPGDVFGYAVALSGDTIVVGAPLEDSNASGVNGNGADNSIEDSGAAYVFVRSGGTWSQQAYLKASNPVRNASFGWSVDIDGATVVVGAFRETSSATGINGDGTNGAAPDAGAAYVFARTGATWSQQAYLKASNTDAEDFFGVAVAISGETVVVGAYAEDSGSVGSDVDQNDDSAVDAGAAYVFVRSGVSWSQQAYLKASNTGAGDQFGVSVAILDNTIVVGGRYEDSESTGVNGNESSEAASNSGAAYVFVRTGATWVQEAYLKASNTGADNTFGEAVAIAANAIIVAAPLEDSGSPGVNGDQTNLTASDSGAVYLFVRQAGGWEQQSYLKATNPDVSDNYGRSIAITDTLIVAGGQLEDSLATGVNGDTGNNTDFPNSGATYIYEAVTLQANDDLTYAVDANSLLIVPEAQGVLANDRASMPLTAVVSEQPATGTLTLEPNGAFTYLPPPNYSGRVTFEYTARGTFNDQSFTDTAQAYIFVGSVAGPTDIRLGGNTILENQPEGTLIGTLETLGRDHGTGYTYSLVSEATGNDNADFTIVDNRLLSNAVFDYEAGQGPQRIVHVRTSNASYSFDQKLTVVIRNQATEPANPPERCNGAPITLYSSGDGEHSAIINGISVVKQSAINCELRGTLTVRFQGQTLHTQALDFNVNASNKLNVGTVSIQPFNANVAGIDVRVREARLSEYNGQLAVRLVKVEVCAPVEWAGDCVDGSQSSLRLDASGLFAGSGAGLPIPDFTINQAPGLNSELTTQSALSGFTSLLKLSAKSTGKTSLAAARIKKVAGGYEITTALALGLPKVPIEKECYIAVSVTFFKSRDGLVTLTIKPIESDPRVSNLEFREGKLGLGCSQGIPIGPTGLQISGVSGTISLRPDVQFVQIAIEITPAVKFGSLLFKADVGAKFFWEPEWGLDLFGKAKMFTVLDVGAFTASVRKDRMGFTGYVQSFVMRGEVTFNAWWPNGQFHFSGSGRVTLGLEEGALYSKCADLVVDEVCVNIPPFDTEVGNVGVEGGLFTNGRYGFKGYAELLGSRYGVFIDEDGDLQIGGVDSYAIATPTTVRLARDQWVAREGMFEAGVLAADSAFTFLDDDAMAFTVAVNPTILDSQVTVATPSDTLFVVSAIDPLVVKLRTPSGDLITPDNAADFNAAYLAVNEDGYTQYMYTVSAAAIGNWQVVLEGDTTTNPPLVSVLGLANIPTIASATLANGANASDVSINWAFRSDGPVKVTIYANPAEVTSTVEVEHSDGTTTTETIDNFSGIPIAEVSVSNAQQLLGALNTAKVNLSTLASGNYALWLSINNEIHPEVNQYLTLPNSTTVARVQVDNRATLPTTWTAALTPTVDPSTAQIVVVAPALLNPDVDSYAINIGSAPNAPTTQIRGGFASYNRDADGNPVGAPFVRQTVDSVRPGETYYISFTAFDEESDWSVTSQEVQVTVSAGAYSLTTAQNYYLLQASESITIPVTLTVQQPLFYPNVYLELGTEELPRGIQVTFENDTLGTTNLSTDAPTAALVVDVDENVPDGLYTFEVIGQNGENSVKRRVSIQVGAAKLFLPVLWNVTNRLPPVKLGSAIQGYQAVEPGAVFFTAEVRFPALPATGGYVLSSSPHSARPILIDDELVLQVSGKEVFVYNFASGNGLTAAVVPIPSTLMSQLAEQTVTVNFRDTNGNQVAATAVYLLWVP